MLAGLGRGGRPVLDRPSGSALPLVGLVGRLRVVGLRLGHALLVGLRSRCSVCVCAGSEPQCTAARMPAAAMAPATTLTKRFDLLEFMIFSFVVFLDVV